MNWQLYLTELLNYSSNAIVKVRILVFPTISTGKWLFNNYRSSGTNKSIWLHFELGTTLNHSMHSELIQLNFGINIVSKRNTIAVAWNEWCLNNVNIIWGLALICEYLRWCTVVSFMDLYCWLGWCMTLMYMLFIYLNFMDETTASTSKL